MRSPSVDRSSPGVGAELHTAPAERSPAPSDVASKTVIASGPPTFKWDADPDEQHLREPATLIELDAWAFVGVLLLVAGGIGAAAVLVKVVAWVAGLWL